MTPRLARSRQREPLTHVQGRAELAQLLRKFREVRNDVFGENVQWKHWRQTDPPTRTRIVQKLVQLRASENVSDFVSSHSKTPIVKKQ